jgi:hypothetical protein
VKNREKPFYSLLRGKMTQYVAFFTFVQLEVTLHWQQPVGKKTRPKIARLNGPIHSERPFRCAVFGRVFLRAEPASFPE